MDFNLIDERWIPCIGQDGKREEAGVREALSRAHELTAIRDPSPLVTAALHRLLLAVLHAALRGPKDLDEWAALYRGGRFDLPAIADYLDRWRGRFNLFDNARPFYQVAGFDLPKALPAARLALEAAVGNNPTLFDHTTDANPPLMSVPMAARYLVADQAFALGLGVGPASRRYGSHPNYANRGPCVGGVLAMLKGRSLFDTLMLNLLVYDSESPIPHGRDPDVPAWEQDPPDHVGRRTTHGYLDLLTWQTNCVRLLPESQGVRRMHYARGEILDTHTTLPDPFSFAYLKKENRFAPVKLQAERALWRDSDSLFTFARRPDTRRGTRPMPFDQAADLKHRGFLNERSVWRCFLVGIATDPKRAAHVMLTAHQELPLSYELLEQKEVADVLRVSLEHTENVGIALRDALQDVARGLLVFAPAAGGGRKPDRKAVQDVAKSLQGERLFWASLELPFKRFLADLPTRGEVGIREWIKKVCVTAHRAFHRAAENSMGLGARELKARVEAERNLNARLRRIQQQVPEPEGGDA